MTRVIPLVVFLCALLAVIGTARAEVAPRVVARADGADVSGLPAISRDGRTVAFVVPFETLSEADRLTITFVRVSDNTATDQWLVYERDDAGSLLAAPADGRGTSPWRRARNLTLHLGAAGYRAMARVGEDTPDATPTLRGEGLRITQRGREVTVRAVRGGQVRFTGTLPEMRAFCGMSDERPRNVAPRVRAAWVDATANVGLLQYGHVYASCMCPSDLAFLAIALAR